MKKILYSAIFSLFLIGCDKLSVKPKISEKQNADKVAATRQLKTMKNKLNIAEITSEKDFSLITQLAVPAVVLFYSNESAPGVFEKKIFESLATNQIDDILFAEINLSTPSSESIGMQNSVFSIPTILLFKNGKEVNRLVGITDIKKLNTFIKK